MSVEPGHYKAVFVELMNSCGTGSSAEIVNGQGLFSTEESIRLEFTGDAILDIHPHIERLHEINADPQISKALDGIQGQFLY
jgi:hypothetical protein